MGNNNLFKYFKRAKLFLFSILLSLSYTTSISQINDHFGNPFIKNFSKKQIKKDLKTFDISQNKNGEIYFATAGSLLEFDGFRWTNYSSKEESDLRAVLYTDDQHIYTAGHGGFGYWSKNSKGILEYSSLFFKHPTKMAPLLPVFSNIVEVEGKILFQSFQQIYSYNPSNTKFNIISATKGFSALFSSNNRAFVQDVSIGLFEIINTEKRIVKGTEKTTLDIAELFLELDNSLLIASKNNGFWSVKDGVLLKKQWKINKEVLDIM